jgi:acetoin utilization protein AcuA
MTRSSGDSKRKKTVDEPSEVEERVLDLEGESKPSRDIGVKPPFFTGWERPMAPPGKEERAKDVGAAPKKCSREIDSPKGRILIENYYPADKLDRLEVDDGIKMFSRHHPDRQKQALLNVARSEEGNVVTAVKGDDLVAYIGIHHSSEKERWGKPGYDWLFEFGAIEVSADYREIGLADGMLAVTFEDPFYEDKIMLTTGFTWHWDLEGTGMNKMEYHDLGVRLFGKYGFMEMATDEPNIQMDNANLFMVRIGRDSSFSRYQKFATLLFANEWEAMLRGF